MGAFTVKVVVDYAVLADQIATIVRARVATAKVDDLDGIVRSAIRTALDGLPLKDADIDQDALRRELARAFGKPIADGPSRAVLIELAD